MFAFKIIFFSAINDYLWLLWKRNKSYLVYTTQVNRSAFCACWSANLEVIIKVLFTSKQPKRNKMDSHFALVTEADIFWSASYSCSLWVYTKTIIHLSVNESGGYLPPLRWIIVKQPMVDPDFELRGGGGGVSQLFFLLWFLPFSRHKGARGERRKPSPEPHS